MKAYELEETQRMHAEMKGKLLMCLEVLDVESTEP